ncbi:uncharacterized protein LOC144630183 isoform X2 [Oculina patagonica]
MKCLVLLLITLGLSMSFPQPRYPGQYPGQYPLDRDPAKNFQFWEPERNPQERVPVLPLVESDPQKRDPVKRKKQIKRKRGKCPMCRRGYNGMAGSETG